MPAIFTARTTSPATGAPDSVRRSASAISALQPGKSEEPFDVGAGVAVPAVPFEAVVDADAGCEGALEREDEKPVRAKRSCGGKDDEFEVAEIHERVGRDDHVEGFGAGAQVFRQLGSHQLVVDRLLFRLREHAFGEIDADQPVRIRRHERAAESRSAAGVEHVEALRRLGPRILRHCGDEGRARYDNRSSFDSKLAAKQSNVVSTNPFDARAGTSRPVHAASMCIAIGSPGSSSSHSLNILTASSISPACNAPVPGAPRIAVLRPEA